MPSAAETSVLTGVTRIPNPSEPVPVLVWPTIMLLVSGVSLWCASTAAGISELWPWWISTMVNAVAAYMLFTVAHDAGHHSASQNSRLNSWLGRLAAPMFAPHAAFQTWRFIHMQHHRFTNYEDGRDPDAYTNRGPRWQTPLRFLTIDLYYVVFYAPKLGSRPRGEKIELAVQWVVVGGITAAAIASGHGVDILVYYYVPARLAVLFLGWAFDYLPHHGLHHTPRQDKFKTTRNRVGGERLLSPVMLYQNYHLVHHLHPVVPFYKYISVWRRNEEAYLAGGPALSTVRGRPLTEDEYRRLRDLATGHDEPARAAELVER